MAEIEESIRTLLLTFDPVTALVSERIRPDRLHESDDPPAIIIEVDDEEEQLDVTTGRGGLVFASVVITCRAETKAVARAVALAVQKNGTTPGTGLAGYTGAAGDQTINAVLETTASSFIPKGDGSDQGYYDVVHDYRVSWNETT